MDDPMREQLGAYLDGELHGPSRQALHAHLETCPECREELASLRRLSETLRSASLPASLPPADLFASRVAARLPPHESRLGAVRDSRAGWLVPAGLLSALVMVQAAAVLGTLLALGGSAGYFGEVGAWFAGSPRQTLWFNAAQAFLGNMLSMETPDKLHFVNNVMVGLQQWMIPLRLYLALTMAYLAWLAVWMVGRQAASGTAALHREQAFE